MSPITFPKGYVVSVDCLTEHPMPANLMTTKEAAAYLRLASSTLEKARVYGTGPRFYVLGAAVRYRFDDLEDWLSQRVAYSTSDVARP
jgi:excisionase family DNA binding protein